MGCWITVREVESRLLLGNLQGRAPGMTRLKTICKPHRQQLFLHTHPVDDHTLLDKRAQTTARARERAFTYSRVESVNAESVTARGCTIVVLLATHCASIVRRVESLDVARHSICGLLYSARHSIGPVDCRRVIDRGHCC